MGSELFNSIGRRKAKTTRQRFTVPLSILAHGLILAGVIVVPLVAMGTVPLPLTSMRFVAVVHTPPVPPPLPALPVITPRVTSVDLNPDVAPTAAPDRVLDEIPPSMPALVDGIRDAVPVPSSGGGSRLDAPPPPAAVAPAGPVRVGGKIGPPRRVHDVPLTYPPIARAARVEGVVELDAVIAKDGTIKDVIVRTGHPMLDQAAVAAVRQWRYSPPTLNGEPVEVVMLVRVEFRLR